MNTQTRWRVTYQQGNRILEQWIDSEKEANRLKNELLSRDQKCEPKMREHEFLVHPKLEVIETLIKGHKRIGEIEFIIKKGVDGYVVDCSSDSLRLEGIFETLAEAKTKIDHFLSTPFSL